MFWLLCIAVCAAAAFLFCRREHLKKMILIAQYETKYWTLGTASTVEDVIHKSANKLPELPKRSNDVAIVTGGSRGIGLEVVKKLLQQEMHVIIGCRKIQAGHNAIEGLRKEGVTTGSADVEELDTSSLKSVRSFASKLLSKLEQLHLLINNAGIMLVPYTLTEDDFESHLAVNYLGHALLTHLLLPLMKQTGRNSQFCSRIVNLSSCAHLAGSINFDDINFRRIPYIPSKAYAQSKLAQLMFSNALNRKLMAENARVSSIAVHPGIVNTDLFNNSRLKRVAPWIPRLIFKTPEQGSRSVVFCALSPSLETEGGLYISNCQKTLTSSLAQNNEQQDKLMMKTMDMLKLTEFCGYKEEATTSKI